MLSLPVHGPKMPSGEDVLRRTLCGLLVAGSMCPGMLAAQELEKKPPAAVFDAKDPAITRRIMLNVAKPAETLAAPMVFYGPVAQPPPGTSPGAAAIGNVLGMLIVSRIEAGKDRTVAEFASGVTQALSGLDMRRELADALRKELERTGHLKGAVLEEVADASDVEQPGLLVRIQERDIFTLDVRCVFDRRMTSLHLLSGVRFWRKDDFKPLHSAQLHYVSKSFGDESEARRRWIEDDGALLKQSLREGIVETARMFAADTALRSSDAALPAETVEASWIAPETGNSAPAPIHVLARGEGRILGQNRAPAEKTVSIPQEGAATFADAPKP